MRLLTIGKLIRGSVSAGLCSILFAGQAEAATQGALEATSTGSVTISVLVTSRSQISGLTDVTFTAVDPASTASSAQSVCVWSNTSNKGYSITASGNGPGNAFALTSGALSTPYSVAWSDSPGQAAGTSLNPGETLTGQVSTATQPLCSSGPATSSSLVVAITAEDLQTMTPDTAYVGALNLLVSPQ